jgi:type IV secretion system protein VirD4
MSATKVLWGQITIVLVVVLITVWRAMQWTAWRFGFQPQLGVGRFSRPSTAGLLLVVVRL